MPLSGPMPLSVTPIVVGSGHAAQLGDRDPIAMSIDDQTLVDRAVGTATRSTRSDPVLTARSSAHADRIAAAVSGVTPASIRVPDDTTSGDDGVTAEVAAAIDAVETPWTFVCGGDMPWLSQHAIRLLAERAARLSPAGVVPLSDGRPEPLHGIYRTIDLERALANACPATTLRGVVERLSPLVTVPATHADDSLGQSLADASEHAERLGHAGVRNTR